METDMYRIKIAYQVICEMLNEPNVKAGESQALTTIKNKLANIIAKYACDEA